MTSQFPLTRAWSATCADGWLRDAFANAVASEANSAAEADRLALGAEGYELVDDFISRCDEIYAASEAGTKTAVEELARSVDVSELYVIQ